MIWETLVRRIFERNFFPSCVRCGFQAERPDVHWFLEQYIPFDLTNASVEDASELEAQKDLEQSEAQLGSILTSLSSGDFAADEQAQLQKLESKVEALGYDEETRRQAYSQVQEWQPFAEKVRLRLEPHQPRGHSCQLPTLRLELAELRGELRLPRLDRGDARP